MPPGMGGGPEEQQAGAPRPKPGVRSSYLSQEGRPTRPAAASQSLRLDQPPTFAWLPLRARCQRLRRPARMPSAAPPARGVFALAAAAEAAAEAATLPPAPPATS